MPQKKVVGKIKAVSGKNNGAASFLRGPGKPAFFTSPESMELKINEYFAECDEKNEPYTMMGLTLYLGFVSRQSLNDYGAREEYSDVIKKARAVVQASVEKMLLAGGNNTVGCIFWLKNHADYHDRQQHEHSGPEGGPIQLSDLERANRIATLIAKAKQCKSKGKR